jgi:polyisoprenoid-binding protein YceI
VHALAASPTLIQKDDTRSGCCRFGSDARVSLGNHCAGWSASGGPCKRRTPETDATRSRLEFTATQAGGDFDGAFGRFQAVIVFNPADLAHSRFRVEIDTASVDTGDKDRDDVLVGGDFFAVERWPKAGFEAARFVSLGGGRFEALGRLTIRDVTREIRLPFSFRPSTDGAQAGMAGGTTIRRLDYGAAGRVAGHQVGRRRRPDPVRVDAAAQIGRLGIESATSHHTTAGGSPCRLLPRRWISV